jgi:hypothetical protein
VVLSEDGRHTVEVRAGHSDVSRFEVPLDTTPPEVTVGGVRDAGDSEELALAVSAADALSGTGDMSVTLDGEPVAPDARVPLYTLALGAHEVVVAARDAAGNLTRRAVPFTTHTSFADMQALMDAFEAAGRFGGPRTEVIRQTFASAVAHADAGRPDAAISALERYDRHVRSDHRVPDAEVAAVLSRDAEEMIRRLAPSPAR